jgi:hypothetical protein
MGCIDEKVREIKDILDTSKTVKQEIEDDDFFIYASELFG